VDTTRLSAWQWRVVILGWVTYAAFYLGRVNLATALPAIEADLHWLPTDTGLLAGAMLWSYGIGQLINGWLGQYVDTRRMVFIGIAGSTVVNLIFAVSSSLPVMFALWLINGYLQSMAWGPILRTLSDNLEPGQRNRIAGVFGASYVVGNTLTWLLTGLLLTSGQWRLTFVVPPLLMFGVGLGWYTLTKPAKSTVHAARENILPGSMREVIRQTWPVLLTAIVAGALINGALLFAPTYAAQTLPVDQAALTAVIFPVSGLLGTVWLSSLVMRRVGGDVVQGLIVLLLISAAARALAVVLPPSTLVSVLLLAAMGVTSYALTNVLLTAVPLTIYAHLGTSVVAGLMDATHSLGGAVGSTLVGLLLLWGSWPLVFIVWTLLPLIAAVVISLVLRRAAAQRLSRQEGIL